ncbi:MAG: triple tyrosine motif-containing protein [Bacteroidales bacterium]
MKAHGKFNQILFAILLQPCLIFYADGQSAPTGEELTSFISNHIPVENQSWSISQNPLNGYMYFANSEGLIEYNGISRKSYNLPYRQTVRSVHVASDGTIYTGSFEEFGYWKQSGGEELRYYSLSEKSGIEKNDEIWKIYELNNKIYFQSFTSVYCYDGKITTQAKSPFTMLFMFRFGDKFIAQVLEKGLYWFDGSGFTLIEGSEIFGRMKVHAVIQVSDRSCWVCTSNNGIYLYENSVFKPVDSEISSYLKLQTCNSGLALNDSIVVFGTIQNGVVICRKNGQIIRKFNYSNGLNNNTVLSLFLDRHKGLWIGLDEGVNYYSIFPLFTVYTDPSGTIGTIYSVLREKDKIYIGTNHGLFIATVFERNQDYSFSRFKLIPGTQGQVWTIEKFDGRILCGHNDGTFQVDGTTAIKISDVTGGWSIREYNDMLIEGTYTGIVFYRKDRDRGWVFRNKIETFLEPTQHIEVDHLGYIWASHPQKGIYRMELNDDADSVTDLKFFNTVSGKPMKLEIHKINNQIIFTGSDSIFEFNYEKSIIVPSVNLNKTLGAYRESYQILPYQKNAYWFIIENKIGLFEISRDFRAEKKFEIAQKYTHLTGRELKITQLSDSSLLIPTRQAFVICNLSALKMPSSGSDIFISRLSFQGRERRLDYLADTRKTSIVPYNTNNLTVYFANPGQYYLDGKEFQYKLAELDEEWHRTTMDHFSYLNLNYGSYTLLIRSDNTDSNVSLTFTIKRPWYLSWYSITTYILLLAGMIVLAVRIFRIELSKQRQLLEYRISQNRLEHELDYKNYELMLTMRYLIQKNEILTQISEQVELIKSTASKYPVKSLRNMDHIINEGLKTQTEEWRDAMNTLKLSQQGFFLKLKELHPELTPHDLRVCSYLRMNFTTKEIAKLLNITTRGVEISRYRLRKKMNLGHDVNLSEYLINLVF